MPCRAEDSWEDWEEAADVPELPKLPATGAAPAVDDKFAGEDEGEDEPVHDVPEPQQVSCLPLLVMRLTASVEVHEFAQPRGSHSTWGADTAHDGGCAA